ncbi:MAG: hypothetical protein XXXJIFNMEKO3_02639 [Candidatus Erwinia impunctatus]|nr:hypothetical protein XXXJIFNMEKO_02639 [Culicoides impunctatus]
MKGYVAKSGKSFKNRVKYILKDDHGSFVAICQQIKIMLVI